MFIPFDEGIVLQCVAVCCSVLQCGQHVTSQIRIRINVYTSIPFVLKEPCCNILQYVAVCCSMLQYVAVCCSIWLCGQYVTLQVWIYITIHTSIPFILKESCCSMFQYVPVCCSVVNASHHKYEFTWMNTRLSHLSWRNRLAVYCSVLQYFAACCSVVNTSHRKYGYT